jgi:hypothetical protein
MGEGGLQNTCAPARNGSGLADGAKKNEGWHLIAKRKDGSL